MADPLHLRVHVSEPFDFERENESADLYGATVDHEGDADEWEVDLEEWFTFNELDYDMVLIAPRYVGEHLGKVHDALLGVPVRIAHRTPNGWHYAMTGMISLAPESTASAPPQPAPDAEHERTPRAPQDDGDLI